MVWKPRGIAPVCLANDNLPGIYLSGDRVIDVCMLGNGGMMPLPGRPLSSALLRVGGETILFDAGEGTQVAWRISDFSFRSTSTILLSHAHADHIAGLPGVLFQIAHSTRTEPVTIYGPQWTAEVVQVLLSIVGRLPYELRVVHLEGHELVDLPGGANLTALPLDHRAPCLGYSISLPRLPRFNPEKAQANGVPMELWKTLQRGEETGGFTVEDITDGPRRGVRVSLITDTRFMDELIPFVNASDLLICESMFASDDDTERARERGHLTIRQACRIAREAQVGRLWLTHFSPKIQHPEEHAAFAQSLFPNAEIAYSGLRATVTFPDD